MFNVEGNPNDEGTKRGEVVAVVLSFELRH
jgi:hypothetical protein